MICKWAFRKSHHWNGNWQSLPTKLRWWTQTLPQAYRIHINNSLLGDTLLVFKARSLPKRATKVILHSLIFIYLFIVLHYFETEFKTCRYCACESFNPEHHFRRVSKSQHQHPGTNKDIKQYWTIVRLPMHRYLTEGGTLFEGIFLHVSYHR